MSSSRSFRLETRSRARDEIKKITQTVDKVRNWEKKWVDLGLSNSIKVYKWVPVREETKEEDVKDVEMSNNDSAHETDLLNMAAPTPLVHDLGGPSTTLPADIFANDQDNTTTIPVTSTTIQTSSSSQTTSIVSTSSTDVQPDNSIQTESNRPLAENEQAVQQTVSEQDETIQSSSANMEAETK